MTIHRLHNLLYRERVPRPLSFLLFIFSLYYSIHRIWRLSPKKFRNRRSKVIICQPLPKNQDSLPHYKSQFHILFLQDHNKQIHFLPVMIFLTDGISCIRPDLRIRYNQLYTIYLRFPILTDFLLKTGGHLSGYSVQISLNWYF